ncbi:hypothetical protein SprV_0100398300 [Sparganum proliferum]
MPTIKRPRSAHDASERSGTNWSHWTSAYQMEHPDDTTRYPPSTSASPFKSTMNTDRTPEPPLPSSSDASSSVATAPAPTATALNPYAPTITKPPPRQQPQQCGLYPYLSSLRSHLHLTHRPGGVERNAKVRTRPCHPPAPSSALGLLDSVLTPGPGGGGESLSRPSRRPCPRLDEEHTVDIAIDDGRTVVML